MRQIALCMTLVSSLFGEPSDSIDLSHQKQIDDAKTIRWKASLFAGAVLLAIVGGIVVISLDGGTPNPQPHTVDGGGDHCHPHDHHHHHHHGIDHCHPDHNQQFPR